MTSRLTNICVDAADPLSFAHLWCAVLGWGIVEESDDGVSIGSADGASPFIHIFPIPDPKVRKNRLYLDLRADGSAVPPQWHC